MLKGLEITEIFKSDLERTQRIDSDFYSKKNLEILNQIDKKSPKALTEFVKVSDGNHVSISEHFSEDGIPYYRGGDIYNFFIEQTSQPLRIPEAVSDWPHMKRSHLQKGDVLLSIVGAIIGNLSLVKTDQKATCSCKLAILRPKAAKPELISTFLKSNFGQNQIQKFRRGSGQTGLILEDFDQLLMPTFSEVFSKKIEAIVNVAFLQSQESQQTYASAETLLLETLGLNNFEPSTEPVNVKSFKDSFWATGRLDAEYYQKKYEDLLLFIEAKTNWKYLKELTTYVSNGNQPPYSEDGEIRFFSQKWIGNKSIDYSFLKSTEEPKVVKSFFEIEKNKTSLVNKGDILYYSVGANLGFCHNYLDDEPIAVGSFINIIRADKSKINEIYLGVVINSILGRLQGEREKSGMAQPYIYAKSLREFKIPILSSANQIEIASFITNALELSKQSEQLLQTAKRAVELAIEQDEESALKFISVNIYGC